MVLAFALLFYGLTAAMAVAGGWLVLVGFPGMLMIPGVILLLIAAYLAPRFDRLPRHADVLRREDAPALYGLVDRIAAAVGTRAPHFIVANPWFDASVAAVGVRRRRVLTLGLSLWGSLEPQQRVALVGYAIGQFANGDLRRGILTQPAMTTLRRLALLFLPDDRRGWGRHGLYDRVVTMLMWPVGAVLFAAHVGMTAITIRDGHRQVYLADQRAASLAGTRATTQLLDLSLTRVSATISSLARANETERSWRAAAAESLRSNLPRQNRLRQLSTRTGVSLLASHPPFGLRAWLVEGMAYQDPAFVLTEAESDRIDAELRRYYERYRRVLAESGV